MIEDQKKKAYIINSFHVCIIKWQVNKKHKPPSSSDSELHALRERLFQRPTILATPTQLTTTPTTPSVRGKEDSAAGAPSEASSNFF